MQFVVVRSLLCLLALLGLVLAPGIANAQPRKKVQVVAIMSDDAFDQAQALTTALKSAVEKDARWDLQSGDFSLEVMVTALNCSTPPDAACLGKIATKIGTDRFVWGAMKKEGANVVAKLRFWDQGHSDAEAALKYSSNLSDAADDKLSELARGALRQLVGAPVGTLVVLSPKTINGGEVWVGGRRAGAVRDGRAKLSLPEGEHEVELRAAGYDNAKSTVTIVSGEQAELTLEPSAHNAESASAAVDSHSAAAGTSQRTLGFVALGAGGVLAAGGVYSMLRVASISEDPAFESYKARLRSDQDACDEAKRGTRVPGATSPGEVSDLCSTAQTFEVLQYVFFDLAAVSTDTDTVLLLTDSDNAPREEQTISVRPRFRPTSNTAQLDLTVAF